ncbi:hypothetical protein [Sphingomonas sp.]|uniref:hypothetical protein n=1 Tax=Sphingomonas sp. TaxID=28214 RepID=UPI0035A9A7F5
MDLGFRQFEFSPQAAERPVSLPLLMVGVAARQAASVTAQLEVRRRYATRTIAPEALGTGAFNGAAARAIMNWKEE